MAKVTIRRLDGHLEKAKYVKHITTLTPNCTGGRNHDVDLYRLDTGEEIEVMSPSDDCRETPWECDPKEGRYSW